MMTICEHSTPCMPHTVALGVLLLQPFFDE